MVVIVTDPILPDFFKPTMDVISSLFKFNWTAIEFRAWISDYIPQKTVHMITYRYTYLNAALTHLPLVSHIRVGKLGQHWSR